MNPNKEIHYRISKDLGVLMIVVAFCVDVLEGLLDLALVGVILNPILALFYFCMFWFWFKIKGVAWINFKNNKMLVTAVATFILEAIPGLDGLFFGIFWTAGVLITVFLSRLEDRTGIKIARPLIDHEKRLREMGPRKIDNLNYNQRSSKISNRAANDNYSRAANDNSRTYGGRSGSRQRMYGSTDGINGIQSKRPA